MWTHVLTVAVRDQLLKKKKKKETIWNPKWQCLEIHRERIQYQSKALDHRQRLAPSKVSKEVRWRLQLSYSTQGLTGPTFSFGPSMCGWNILDQAAS